ncbi:MAG TPA: DUF3419 family protein [Haliangium sp.]|nr:DUF3419 family protein [Haliangium sp.]
MSQRYFSTLNYTLGDEDTSVEWGILPMERAHVACIAGSGGRMLPLLARKPEILTCIDISESQLALTEMRVAALRDLDYEAFVGFLGYPPFCMPPKERESCFRALSLAAPARAILQPMFERAGWPPIIYLGKFEQMLIRFSRIIRLFTGRRGRQLLDCTTLAEQRAYIEQRFPHARWRAVVFLLGNGTVLNTILYKGEFPRKNIPGSASAFYARAFSHLFQYTLARDSFFLQLLFLGALHHPEGNALECRRDIYEQAKQALATTDLRLVRGDFVEVLRAAHRPLDFVAVSDVPSFLPDDRAGSFLQDIRPALNPEAIVVTRGHLRVADPDRTGFRAIESRFDDLVRAETTQLWHIRVYEHVSSALLTAPDPLELRSSPARESGREAP